MSVTPSSGRRGAFPLDSTSARREEAIQRLWTFLAGIATKHLRVYGEGAVVGKLLVAEDALGNVTFSSTLPSTTVALTGQTISQTATVVATALGEYLITIYLQCTTAGAAGTVDLTLTHTDDIAAVTTPILASVALGAVGRDRAATAIRCSGGGIDWTATVTGGAAAVYAVHIAVVQGR